MNVVTFNRVEGPCGPQIHIAIDGRALKDWAREIELPFATAEGNPGLAGSYEGLTPEQVARSRSHFLGTPTISWFRDGDTVLLGCDCGEWGCWPLTATVIATASEVTWERFRTGHRDWDLHELGPFHFGRDAYEAALDNVLPRR